jgi:hypothetical protein
MAIKFNVDPYYDDFLKAGTDTLSPKEKYHKVLFRPGIAVQARELTQLQSILQNQTTQFGNHMFKEGAMVIPGGNAYNNYADYVKLSASSATVSDSLVGKEYANSDGLRAKIIKAVAAVSSDPDTFYVVYQNSNGATNTDKVFSANDTLTEQIWNESSSSYDAGTATATVAATAPTGQGAIVQLESGIYFIRGHFVIVKAETLVLSKYTNNVSFDVGLEITESVSTSAEDNSLNDNATGTPNYAAPGAHRYSIKTALKTQANFGATIDNFLLLLRVVNGKIQKQVRETDYSVIEDTLARRTYDESGDYTVRPFRATMKEDTDVNTPGDATKLVAAIEPSKAYVRGYEIETLATTNLSINKSREAALFEGASVSSLVGNYIRLTASTVEGIPDIITYNQISLHSAVSGGGTGLGFARVRSIEKDGTDYKLYLFDIELAANAQISQIKSVKMSTTFSGNVTLVNSKAVLYEPNRNTLVFALPFSRVKTCDDGTGDFNYVYFSNKKFPADTVSAGEATFSTSGSTELFEPFDTDNWILAVTNGSNAGDIAAISSSDVAITANSQSVTISGLSAHNNQTVELIAGVKKTLDHDSKSLTTSGSQNIHQVAFTSQSTIEAGNLQLGKADGYRLLAVYMAADFSTDATNTDTDVKEYYDFDNGQRDNFYGISKITIKPGTNFVPTGRLLVKYEFFTHDGTGDFFSVDSYSGLTDDDGNTITYEDIPSYTVRATGEVVELRSAIDFRPRVSDAGNNFTGTGAVTKLCPEPATTFTTDIQYYLNRRDKVYLDKNGEFGVVEGVPSLDPELPDDPKDSMVLYQLLVPAYTLKPSDVEIVVLDNKRYTMRDIGKLDRRINTLEYYTSLSFLEKEASDRQVVDSTGALQRFKNGFVVDSFKSYNVADVISPDFRAAIDPDDGILRPQFSQESTRLRYDASSSTGIQKTGDLVTLPYTSQALVQQAQASSLINVNPYDVFTWQGSVDLSPSSDEWRDVSRRPAVTIDNSGVTNAMLEQLNESTSFGTVWNNWQTQWTGTQVQRGNWIRNTSFATFAADGNRGRRQSRTITSTTTENQTRVGTTTALAWSTQVETQGDRIVSIDIAPFIRSRQISFRATRMKPNTRVYAFFDGVDVSSFVREESSYTLWSDNDTSVVTGQNTISAHPSTAGNLITDATGAVTGSFFIPNNTATNFQTGSRVFRLTDSSTNDTVGNTTEASASYVARGLIDNVEEVFLSTRIPRVEQTAVSDNRIITNTRTRVQDGWWDPLAQSFLIDETGGAYITKADVYFGEKDDNIPVTVQIREMVNGYPSARIAPFGEVVKNAADVSISATGATATTFTFESPVFLQENVEYCIVLLANTNKYKVWHAVMGEEDLAGVKINKQPYAGVMFKSQNASTWTADQNADLKFTIHRADFTTGATANLVLKNDEPEQTSLQYDPFKCTSGSAIVRVSHKNHGFFKHATVNSSVTISGVPTGTNIHGIPAAELNATHVVDNVEQDSYTITVSTNATTTGIGGAGTIDATDNRAYQAFQTNVQQVLLTGTNITWSAKTASGLGLMETSRTPYVLDTAYSAIIPNETMYASTTRVIATTDNKNSSTFLAKGAFTSSRSNLSPAVDLERASVFTIGNRIDRPVGSTTAGFNVVDNFVAENTTGTGSALAKYVTKTVLLNEASSTLKIFIDVSRPNNTEFEIYYKTAADEAAVDALAWSLATPDSPIPVNDTGAFNEVEWSVDPSEEFNAFAIKIVMKTENPALVPQASALRAIALV